MNLKRYENNPFLTGEIENFPMLAKKSKQKRVYSNLEKDRELVDTVTGEVKTTHMVTYQEFDAEEFIKIFTKNLSLFLDLSLAAYKVLNVIYFIVQKKALGKDEVRLIKETLEEFNEEYNASYSLRTFQRGVNDLVKAKILAATKYQGKYFINPGVIFNGNRFTLINVFKKREEKVKITPISQIQKEGNS